MVGGLMYLADTNLIAEILLRQTKAGERRTPAEVLQG